MSRHQLGVVTTVVSAGFPKVSFMKSRYMNKKVKRNVQTFSDSNICMFGRRIQNQNWYEVNTASDVQSKADAFYRLVNGAITTIFSVKSVTSHASDKSWMTDRIKNFIDQCQRAYVQSDTENWAKLRNRVIREIKETKISHNINRVRKTPEVGSGSLA